MEGLSLTLEIDVEQTTQEYKTTTVIVSLITYLVALISIIAVNWEEIKRKASLWCDSARVLERKSLLWWNTLRTKGSVKASSDSEPQIPPVDPTSKTPASRPEERGKSPDVSNEKVDVESSTNELVGGSYKAKPLWHIW